jgi:DNA-binding response OmpR family regulator
MNLPLELSFENRTLRAVSQDLSRCGMFIRLGEPLAVGSGIQIAISPEGVRCVARAVVTHRLSEADARTLGRYPGVGVTFREPMSPGDHAFVDAVTRVLERNLKQRPRTDLRIVVADPETRVLERLSTALGTAGFAVATATNGMEAIGAALSKTPDVALVERDMPVVDGLHVLQEMGRDPALAGVPVMMMSQNATDLMRLQAFQLGCVDFIPKPFTVLEVILRARRWARTRQRDTERVMLRGSLFDVALPSLLQMLESEKKTGQLSVTRDDLVAWIDFVDGRIVRARSSEVDGDSRTVVMHMLDWRHGYFELAAGAEAPLDPENNTSVTQLLLEHAQLRDEANR